MKLEQQVVSLELAKKLKELGVKQESLWLWIKLTKQKKLKRGKEWNIVLSEVFLKSNAVKVNPEYYSAFTVAELGEMLPNCIDAKSKKDRRKTISYYWRTEAAGLLVYYAHHLAPLQILCEQTANTEADARAKMLIYLIEQDYLGALPPKEEQ